MKPICVKYKLRCIKISPLKTALVGRSYALIIAIDRFDAKVSYLYVRDGKATLYSCDNYFAEKYDENDRTELLAGEGAEKIVRNHVMFFGEHLLLSFKSSELF